MTKKKMATSSNYAADSDINNSRLQQAFMAKKLRTVVPDVRESFCLKYALTVSFEYLM